MTFIKEERVPTMGIVLGILTTHYVVNHLRIRSYKNRFPKSVVVPASKLNEKELAIVFIPGTGQNSNSCKGRMNILSAQGYECHALNLTQTGNFTTSYKEQMQTIEKYVSALDKPFVLVGHSQGGVKAQMYALSDATCKPEAIILLASADLDLESFLSKDFPKILLRRPMTTFLSMLIGSVFFFDSTAILYGPGPLRYVCGFHREMFNPDTFYTTLTGNKLSLKEFAEQAIDSHDPFVSDIQHISASLMERIHSGRSNGIKVLQLVAEDDVLVQRSTTDRLSSQWGVDPVVVSGQGHEMGDPGWEKSIMQPIISFLESLK